MITTGALAAAVAGMAIGLGGTASAFPGNGTAADTQAALEAEGYSVQVNGIVTGGLSQCTTTGIHPRLSDTTTAEQKANTTVFIDVSCPPE
jgi:glycerate kinase